MNKALQDLNKKLDTDAALSIEKSNRNDLYKDRIRTIEMLARIQRNTEQAQR